MDVSPDTETPHPPPAPQPSPKQQPMNELINFTSALALRFQNKGQESEAASLGQCDLNHKLGSVWHCTAALLLTMMLLMLGGLMTYNEAWLFNRSYCFFIVCHMNYSVLHLPFSLFSHRKEATTFNHGRHITRC